jgi:hypothetical protein
VGGDQAAGAMPSAFRALALAANRRGGTATMHDLKGGTAVSWGFDNIIFQATATGVHAYRSDASTASER